MKNKVVRNLKSQCQRVILHIKKSEKNKAKSQTKLSIAAIFSYGVEK